METTLHRQLKERYCRDAAGREVWVDGYRVDAVVKGVLIEIQYGSLGALRQKLRGLLETHDVVVVKPLAARKTLIKRRRKGGPVESCRLSPLHHSLLHVFDDLVHFVDLFPHPRLTLEVLLTEQEEHRLPARRRRFRGKDYRVQDRLLIGISRQVALRTADDLQALLPVGLADPFTTEDLARLAAIPRWLAQKMAYCLRRTGALLVAGKRRNTVLYRMPGRERKAA